ncbi:hypothetical protein J2Z31_002724 [Sinorhizobium kostiense]|uniref:Uncharacterized protein n=1 Tax=Sinorhizobium kostiense TaxID=76747 RepID=A0ABS4QZZ6_9HYPH|nr:hypothetical protein [Sinorhizobium kostiense]
MTHPQNWRSAFAAALDRARKPAVSPGDPAKAAPQATGLRDDTRPAGSEPGEPHLLLMRIEALQLNPTRVKALMPADFRVLAHVCDYCQDKVRCERDLLYEAAGKAVSWENYCPNVYRLEAMGLLQTVRPQSTGRSVGARQEPA